MALFLISYDIDEKDKPAYESLWELLRNMGATRILYSEWIVTGNINDANDIYDRIMPLLKVNDRLLVQEVCRNAGWDKLLIADDAFRTYLEYARG